jgi:hypothetical protein
VYQGGTHSQASVSIDAGPEQFAEGSRRRAEIAAAAIRAGVVVLRPLSDGGRYDLVIDTGTELLRLQCKWASRQGNVLIARCLTSRHTPRGYIKTTYSAEEIDAIAIYAPDTDRCYLVPIREVEGHGMISLRVGPTGNNQAIHVRWARDYELGASLDRNRGVGQRRSTPPGEPASRAIGFDVQGL